MNKTEYEHVCDWTQRRAEHLPVCNLKKGEIGYTVDCADTDETVQVQLKNGKVDSWKRKDCAEVGK